MRVRVAKQCHLADRNVVLVVVRPVVTDPTSAGQGLSASRAEGRTPHRDTDEFFLVSEGSLKIRMDAGDVELWPGQMHVVCCGVQHQPVSVALRPGWPKQSARYVNEVADEKCRRASSAKVKLMWVRSHRHRGRR